MQLGQLTLQVRCDDFSPVPFCIKDILQTCLNWVLVWVWEGALAFQENKQKKTSEFKTPDVGTYSSNYCIATIAKCLVKFLDLLEE